ncbi:MAG: hypothetical protein ACTHU0_27895 [Kofleriaceae bacterium]
MTTGLRPFWRYYGGKWRAAPSYPAPRHQTIIEPFAGAAGYSLRHGIDRDVVLVEKYPTIAAIWRYLIAADPAEIRAIPEVDDVDDLPAWVPQAARWLVGFSMNSAASTPRRTLSAGRRMLRAKHRQFEGWTAAQRERVATQVKFIRHWQIIEGDYTLAPDVDEATWFIDPPYERAGRHYVHGSSGIDYAALGAWCRARRGQTIVCEQVGATWLPFRPHAVLKAGPNSQRSAEAVWP